MSPNAREIKASKKQAAEDRRTQIRTEIPLALDWVKTQGRDRELAKLVGVPKKILFQSVSDEHALTPDQEFELVDKAKDMGFDPNSIMGS